MHKKVLPLKRSTREALCPSFHHQGEGLVGKLRISLKKLGKQRELIEGYGFG